MFSALNAAGGCKVPVVVVVVVVVDDDDDGDDVIVVARLQEKFKCPGKF